MQCLLNVGPTRDQGGLTRDRWSVPSGVRVFWFPVERETDRDQSHDFNGKTKGAEPTSKFDRV